MKEKTTTSEFGELFGMEVPDYRAVQTLIGPMRTLAKEGESCPIVVSLARQLTADATNDTEKIARVFKWVKDHMPFQDDPMIFWKGKMREAEVIRTPENHLLRVQAQGNSPGDCDDSSTLLAALYLACGMRTGFCCVATGLHGDEFDHVFSIVFNRDLGHYVSTDAATKRYDWTGNRFLKMEISPNMKSTFGAFPWEALIQGSSSTLSNIFGKTPAYPAGYYPAGYPSSYPTVAPDGFATSIARGWLDTPTLIIGGILVLVVLTMSASGRR